MPKTHQQRRQPRKVQQHRVSRKRKTPRVGRLRDKKSDSRERSTTGRRSLAKHKATRRAKRREKNIYTRRGGNPYYNNTENERGAMYRTRLGKRDPTIDYQIVSLNGDKTQWVNDADFAYGVNGDYGNQLLQIGTDTIGYIRNYKEVRRNALPFSFDKSYRVDIPFVYSHNSSGEEIRIWTETDHSSSPLDLAEKFFVKYKDTNPWTVLGFERSENITETNLKSAYKKKLSPFRYMFNYSEEEDAQIKEAYRLLSDEVLLKKYEQLTLGYAWMPAYLIFKDPKSIRALIRYSASEDLTQIDLNFTGFDTNKYYTFWQDSHNSRYTLKYQDVVYSNPNKTIKISFKTERDMQNLLKLVRAPASDMLWFTHGGKLRKIIEGALAAGKKVIIHIIGRAKNELSDNKDGSSAKKLLTVTSNMELDDETQNKVHNNLTVILKKGDRMDISKNEKKGVLYGYIGNGAVVEIKLDDDNSHSIICVRHGPSHANVMEKNSSSTIKLGELFEARLNPRIRLRYDRISTDPKILGPFLDYMVIRFQTVENNLKKKFVSCFRTGKYFYSPLQRTRETALIIVCILNKLSTDKLPEKLITDLSPPLQKSQQAHKLDELIEIGELDGTNQETDFATLKAHEEALTIYNKELIKGINDVFNNESTNIDNNESTNIDNNENNTTFTEEFNDNPHKDKKVWTQNSQEEKYFNRLLRDSLDSLSKILHH